MTEAFRLRVATPQRDLPEELSFALHEEMTVLELKQRITSKLEDHPSAGLQRLIYRGRSLADGDVLKDVIKEVADKDISSTTILLILKPTESAHTARSAEPTRTVGDRPIALPGQRFTQHLPASSQPAVNTNPPAIPTEFPPNQTIQPLNVQYDAVLVGNQPYLIQRPLAGPRQVVMPPNSTIPIRSTSGASAIIVSPEGVQALAAQGVNVANLSGPNAMNNPQMMMPFNAAQMAAQVRARATHLWLFVRLMFLVGIFSANASWHRFALLNLVASLVFCWQTGQMAPLARLVGRIYQRQQVPTADDPLEDRNNQTLSARVYRALRGVERAFILFIASMVPSLHDNHEVQAAAAAADAAEELQAGDH